MAWYQDIVAKARSFGVETKASAAASTLVMHAGQAVWTPRDYKSFAREAYSQNVVAYQAINKIAEAVASVEFLAFAGDKELKAHPLLDLIKRPNPMQSKSEYLAAKIGYLLIAGNSYEERVTDSRNIRELYQIRPDRTKVTLASSGLPQKYTQTIGMRSTDWLFDDITMKCDLRHLKLFNPLNDVYGMSPIEATAYAVDQSNEGMSWLQALLQNSARPSGALTMKDGQSLSPEAFNRLKKQIEDQYSGSRNAGRPMLLEGGLDWTAMGLSPTDMGIIEAKSSAARDIALGLGVPPQLLGIPGDNTYANYKEARLAFWEDTVMPLVAFITEDWNSWFGQIYDNVEIRPNFDEIPAIVEKRRELWDMADKATDLTIDERRELKGYEPLPNGAGAVILVSSALIPLELAADTSWAEKTPKEPEEDPIDPQLDPANDPGPLDEPLDQKDLRALAYGLKYAA